MPEPLHGSCLVPLYHTHSPEYVLRGACEPVLPQPFIHSCSPQNIQQSQPEEKVGNEG